MTAAAMTAELMRKILKVLKQERKKNIKLVTDSQNALNRIMIKDENRPNYIKENVRRIKKN
jgi:hypothetical protein